MLQPVLSYRIIRSCQYHQNTSPSRFTTDVFFFLLYISSRHLLIFNYQVNDILFDLYQMYIVLTFDSLFIVYMLTYVLTKFNSALGQ
jgi:hypothetical protein